MTKKLKYYNSYMTTTIINPWTSTEEIEESPLDHGQIGFSLPSSARSIGLSQQSHNQFSAYSQILAAISSGKPGMGIKLLFFSSSNANPCFFLAKNSSYEYEVAPGSGSGVSVGVGREPSFFYSSSGFSSLSSAGSVGLLIFLLGSVLAEGIEFRFPSFYLFY